MPMPKRIVPRRLSRRAFIVVLLHVAAFLAAYSAAYSLRFDFAIPEKYLLIFWITLPAILTVKTGVFYALGHCHVSWRYVTFSDLAALIRAATLAALILVAFQRLMESLGHMVRQDIPLSVLFVDWGLTILLLGGMRAAARLSREEVRPFLVRNGAKKSVIVGANRAGESLARHLQSDDHVKYQVIAFLDKDEKRHGSSLAQIPVLAHPQHTVDIAGDLGVEVVLIVSDALTGNELRVLMEECATVGLEIKVIPALDELISGDYSLQIRDVNIDDLLRREPVQLDDKGISTLLQDHVVLVTGAGGSIGAEICRQVIKYRPQKLVMIEQAENNLFFIDQELRNAGVRTELVPQIADITDEARIRQVFVAHKPAVVFHAAAHKHVPMMELNPGEAIKNNVLGTKLLAELADEHGVDEFVMISTDKAVNPTSVMGVSKQLAERFVHAFSEIASTKFVAVRFGNVLASNGSVVPIFQEQIRRGGPITVTHRDIERYFMTIPEASQLVLQAATMGQGGEIFVLDMGRPVRILDLAHDLIRLSGLSLDDIEIVFTGLRPGEKLYEELYFEDEETMPTPHSKVFMAYHRPCDLSEVRNMIDELAALVHAPAEELRKKVRSLVPEYVPPLAESLNSERSARPAQHSALDTSADSSAVLDLSSVPHSDTR